MNFPRVLKEVLWCLVTEGSMSYRLIKRGFDLDDDALEDVRREMISTLRIAPMSRASFWFGRPRGA